MEQPSIAGLLRGYSVEIDPSSQGAVEEAGERFAPGTEVYLTWIPGRDPMLMAAPAAALLRAGLVPVPHLGARHLESRAQLEELAGRLADAGVDRVLIVGGDRRRPAGPYDSSLAVMQTGVLQSKKIRGMAVGGFPEGNPNIAEAELDRALVAKADLARSQGIALSIVTQFCFRHEPIVSWLERIRGLGIDAPVRVGLAGPAGLVTLMRYAVRCGVGNSMHMLTQHPSFAKLLTEQGPEPIVRGVGTALQGHCERLPAGIAGFHFFVFGGLRRTIDWIDAQLAR